MNKREAVKKAIELAGGQTALARLVGTRQSSVFNWLNRGQEMPADQVLTVAWALDFEITPHEMRPDLYPYPDDALPKIERARILKRVSGGV